MCIKISLNFEKSRDQIWDLVQVCQVWICVKLLTVGVLCSDLGRMVSCVACGNINMLHTTYYRYHSRGSIYNGVSTGPRFPGHQDMRSQAAQHSGFITKTIFVLWLLPNWPSCRYIDNLNTTFFSAGSLGTLSWWLEIWDILSPWLALISFEIIIRWHSHLGRIFTACEMVFGRSNIDRFMQNHP